MIAGHNYTLRKSDYPPTWRADHANNTTFEVLYVDFPTWPEENDPIRWQRRQVIRRCAQMALQRKLSCSTETRLPGGASVGVQTHPLGGTSPSARLQLADKTSEAATNTEPKSNRRTLIRLSPNAKPQPMARKILLCIVWARYKWAEYRQSQMNRVRYSVAWSLMASGSVDSLAFTVMQPISFQCKK